MTWRVQVGSVYETGGLVLRIGSVGGQRGGGKHTWGPKQVKPAVPGF
jgi:hypothetical protein